MSSRGAPRAAGSAVLSGRTPLLSPGDAARGAPLHLTGSEQVHRHRPAAVWLRGRTAASGRSSVRRHRRRSTSLRSGGGVTQLLDHQLQTHQLRVLKGPPTRAIFSQLRKSRVPVSVLTTLLLLLSIV